MTTSTVTVTLRQASRLGGYKRPWVARLTGRDPKYRFSRVFVEAATTEHGGTWTFELPDGYYEICDRNSKGAERRSFVRIAGGHQDGVEESAILAALDGPTVTELRQAVRVAPEDTTVKAALADALEEKGQGAEAAHVRASLEPRKATVRYECLECGYDTDDPSEIDAGGMGCVRCNH